MSGVSQILCCVFMTSCCVSIILCCVSMILCCASIILSCVSIIVCCVQIILCCVRKSVCCVCRYGPPYKTDHFMITLHFSVHSNNRGRGFWKLNTSFLNDPECISLIQPTIQETQNEYVNDDYVNPRENEGTEREAQGVGRDMSCPRKLF